MIRNYLRRAYRTVVPLLYARSRFKLFLATSLGDLDLRRQQLASVTDYFASSIRPIPIRAPFGKSMLVVAPHQDDETIGCGGALALQVRSGNAAAIVMVQDGADGHEELGITRQALTEMRNEESRRAAAVLSLEPPRFLNHARLPKTSREPPENCETSSPNAKSMPYSRPSCWTVIRITVPPTRSWLPPCKRSPGTCGSSAMKSGDSASRMFW